jgi:hypothetical protein
MLSTGLYRPIACLPTARASVRFTWTLLCPCALSSLYSLVHVEAPTPLSMSLAGTSYRDSATKLLCCTRLRVNDEMASCTCCKLSATGGCWVGGSGLHLGGRGPNTGSHLACSRSCADPRPTP